PREACAAGGVRIEMGVDRNGNGVLDPSEIDSTEILCGDEALNHIFLGSFYIRSDADVELLSKYSIALGHILISVPGDYHGADPSPHITPSAFEMAWCSCMISPNDFISILRRSVFIPSSARN